MKPGELMELRAGAALSLQDKRIFNLLIDNAWSEIAQDKTHRIAILRLRGPRHKGGERVADSVSTLMTSLVEIPATLEGHAAVLKVQLLGPTTQVIDEDSAHAVLLYSFSRELREIIKDSRYWGRIKASVMFAFTSKYALSLYEAVCLRANLRVNEQTFSVEEFRTLIGVEPGKYGPFKNLKLRVLDPAVTELNGLSDFTVEVEPIRDGGMVRGPLKGFRLRWEKKPAEEWQGVLDELFRSKVGRRARISGKVEKVTAWP